MPDSGEAGYAFWVDADSSFRIEYSLSLFHEIDFSAGEGFRSIPHGGMETGGLLFGQRTEGCARIEAFRPIECEHASGPSFVLSERDLQRIAEQLAAAKADPDLSDLEPLGWFIAHTRSELAVSDRELEWFDRFFPETGKIALLVKPERFQPTRFAFLIRKRDGQLERDGRGRAIILPLPGRASGAANGPVPSIPAPRGAPLPAAVTEKAKPERTVREGRPELPVRRREPIVREPEALAEPIVPAQPRALREREEAPRRIPDRRPEFIAAPAAERPRYQADPEMFAYSGYAGRRRAERERERRLPTGVRLFLVLLVAAALGCAAGYWAYVQLPSATIRLSVQPRGTALVVYWPPGQTSGAAYAAIRIDDGAPIPLSDADKATGETTIKASGNDVKIELTVQHWMRQSRGIVRFVSAAVPEAAPAS